MYNKYKLDKKINGKKTNEKLQMKNVQLQENMKCVHWLLLW